MKGEIKNMVLLGISVVLIGVGASLGKYTDSGNYLSSAIMIIGLYGLALFISDNAETKLNMLNTYRIIAVFMFCISAIISVYLVSQSYVSASIWGGFGENFGDNVDALADAIIKVLDYLSQNQNKGLILR